MKWQVSGILIKSNREEIIVNEIVEGDYRAFVVAEVLSRYQNLYHPEYVFWKDYPFTELILDKETK